MNKTDAWMPLWIGAYLADTQHLTRDEHGAYLLLIMAYWRNAGPLVADDKRMSAICKATQKEWKGGLRESMSEFFEEIDGFWHHRRIEKELSDANAKKTKSSNKAKAAAQARWGNQTDSASSSAPRNAPSIAQAVQEDCPTPTPTPSISVVDSVETHTEIYSEQGANARVTPAGVCKLMISRGIPPTSCNSGNPELIALVDAGASWLEFDGAALAASKKGKGFAYALAIVTRQRSDAAKLVLHKGAMPNRQEALEQSNKAATSGWTPPELREAVNAN